MTVVANSSAATATAYSNQRKVDRCQNGVLWSLHWGGGGSINQTFSTDEGATWSANATAFTFASTGTTYTPNVSFFIDVDDYAHAVYKDRHDGFLYYRRGTPNAARTAWTWSAALSITPGNLANNNYPDIVAHREGTGWKAHVVASHVNSGGPADRVAHVRIDIDSAGTASVGAQTWISGDYGNAVAKYPSIDFNHTGDGKTVVGGTPHLYAAWSAGAAGAGKGIRFRKATYSAGAWTWGTDQQIDSTRYVPNSEWWLNCLFDGARAIVVGNLYDGSTEDTVLYERDAADTTTTTRVLIDRSALASADALRWGTTTYDGDGNVYLFGTNTDESAGTYDLVYRKWTRATTTLEAEVVIDPGVGTPYVSAKRGYSDGRIEFIYTDGTASPYSVTYDVISLNAPPNAPALVYPLSGTTIDREATVRFDWDFSDPDTGDSQSKYDFQLRAQGAGTNIVDVSITSTATYRDIVGGTMTANGAHEWRVLTYDAQGVPGPWSAWEPFDAGTTPATPTITSPVDGQTISSESELLQWSAPNQDAYEWRRVADNAGSPDPTTIYASGGAESSSARSVSVSFPTNNRTEHLQLRIRYTNLYSTWASVRLPISFTTPPVPLVALTIIDASEIDPDATGEAGIRATITNPAPVGDEPAVSSNDLWRRVAASGGEGGRIATALAANGAYGDVFIASGVAYEYRVKALGDNGTSNWSAWT